MPRYVDAEEAKKNVFGVLHCEYATPEEDMALSAIDDTPTADVEPIVHAHWIRRYCDHRNDYYDVLAYPYICSACREKNKEATKRCPECGARMDEKVRDK